MKFAPSMSKASAALLVTEAFEALRHIFQTTLA
jgi:hypothetical protein